MLGSVDVGVLAGLGADVHHLTLLHDEHALSVRNGDQAAVGDNVVIALGVAGTARDLLFALDRQHIRGDRLAIKVFLPLVGQHAASRAHCRFDQSHNSTLLFLLLYLISAFAFDRIL